MKSVYNFLQNYAVLICIAFGVTPYAPPFIQQNFDYGTALYITWAILFASAVTFVLCFWWLNASWVIPKPACMTAVTFASVLGLMISATALFPMYGYDDSIYMLWRETPAQIVQSVMIISLLYQTFLDWKS